MSGQGIVTTARGESLNLDDLIEKAKRPIGMKETASEKVQRIVPKVRNLNVRAFSPAMGSAQAPEVPDDIKQQLEVKATPSAFQRNSDGVAKSMADMTGIRVDAPRHIDPRRVKEEGTEIIKNEALTDILSSLENDNPNARSVVMDDDELEDKAEKTSGRGKAAKK